MSNPTGRLTMNRLPVGDQPVEKLVSRGVEVLSDAELMAVIIRSGTSRHTALELCQQLLADDPLRGDIGQIPDLSLEELTRHAGIGKVKAAQIKAAAELGMRMTRALGGHKVYQIRKPDDAIRLMEGDMASLPREEMRAILLDVRNRVIRVVKLSQGGLAATILAPRDLFRDAVKANASSLILAHNHPSGDSEPSREDLETTHRLVKAGEMIGIEVMDHIILASKGSISFKQGGFI